MDRDRFWCCCRWDLRWPFDHTLSHDPGLRQCGTRDILCNPQGLDQPAQFDSVLGAQLLDMSGVSLPRMEQPASQVRDLCGMLCAQ